MNKLILTYSLIGFFWFGTIVGKLVQSRAEGWEFVLVLAAIVTLGVFIFTIGYAYEQA